MKREKIQGLSIRSRILGMFLIIILVAITAVSAINYTAGRNNIEKIMRNQLDNSVRFVTDKISLLNGAYTSKEFSGELKHVIISEKASFSQSGLEPEIYIIDSNTHQVSLDNINSPSSQKTVLPESFTQNILKIKYGNLEVNIKNKTHLTSFGYVVEKDWYYIIAVPKSSYMRPVNEQLLFTFITGAAAILLAFIFSYWGSMKLIRDIKNIKKAASFAAEGNLTIRAANCKGGAETKALASGFNNMISNFEKLIKQLAFSIEQISTAGIQLDEIAKQSQESSTHVYSLTRQMSSGTKEQSEILEKVSSSTNEILVTMEQIIVQIKEATHSSTIMLETVSTGITAVDELNTKISEIDDVSEITLQEIEKMEERSREIDTILEVIKRISNQTKLLSLNASIEAAKAGEFGRGFNVVADEIKKLAENCAQSAHDVSAIIKELYKNMDSVVNVAARSRSISVEGAEIAGNTNSAFKMISDKVSQTHKSIKDISVNTGIISQNISVYTSNINKIQEIISQISAISQEAAVTVEKHHSFSGDVLKSASNLLNMANGLNEIKDEFKYTI